MRAAKFNQFALLLRYSG